MNPQIEIQFTGTYQLDETTMCVNPLAIAESATDNFIDSVSLTVVFVSPTYSYTRNIGSFTYDVIWTNQDVIDYITNYMNSIQIN
jgi:hypothetical protein